MFIYQGQVTRRAEVPSKGTIQEGKLVGDGEPENTVCHWKPQMKGDTATKYESSRIRLKIILTQPSSDPIYK